ncbi:TetR family transcriptional regulator [Tamaricihabitans halophyticus]|uniref:TetR family transcriptional regulator n=1 Tax=Tamaricihabitans halophyticus TaxID=1262583 RepID=A0A4R2QN78_9PSEU|nr:TetR/AcrR family transcriptional regulator [Tamaricihabitans halophyticus]TCP48521.1 TetR family transcriptional regulator [Tamaricihabitans halophyticus]
MPPRSRSRSRNDRHPRDQLKEAGTRLFFDKGFHGTTVRDITEACGLTPGALYNHFGSKEEVLRAIILDGHAELDNRLAAVPAGPAPERLRRLLEVFVLHHARFRREAMVGDEWKALEPKARKEVRAKRLALRESFESTIRAGVEAGEFVVPKVDGGDPVRLATMALLDMGFRTCSWFRPKSGVVDAEFARFYADLALATLLKQ